MTGPEDWREHANREQRPDPAGWWPMSETGGAWLTMNSCAAVEDDPALNAFPPGTPDEVVVEAQDRARAIGARVILLLQQHPATSSASLRALEVAALALAELRAQDDPGATSLKAARLAVVEAVDALRGAVEVTHESIRDGGVNGLGPWAPPPAVTLEAPGIWGRIDALQTMFAEALTEVRRQDAALAANGVASAPPPDAPGWIRAVWGDQ